MDGNKEHPTMALQSVSHRCGENVQKHHVSQARDPACERLDARRSHKQRRNKAASAKLAKAVQSRNQMAAQVAEEKHAHSDFRRSIPPTARGVEAEGSSSSSGNHERAGGEADGGGLESAGEGEATKQGEGGNKIGTLEEAASGEVDEEHRHGGHGQVPAVRSSSPTGQSQQVAVKPSRSKANRSLSQPRRAKVKKPESQPRRAKAHKPQVKPHRVRPTNHSQGP